MKITILPFQKKEEPLDAIMLYNLIKRSQEDLLSIYPQLREFILEIRMHPNFIKYNSLPHAGHVFNTDESIITLTIASYPQQLPEKVYQLISERLLRVRMQ